MQNSAKADPIDTRKEVAKLADVSHDTYAKAKVVIEKASDELKQQVRKGDQPGATFQISEKLSEPINALKEAAKTADMSHDTLRKIEVIEQKAPEELKQQVRKGDVSINAAYKKVTSTKPKKAKKSTPAPGWQAKNNLALDSAVSVVIHS